jgi:H+/gluconate symporter-like permease
MDIIIILLALGLLMFVAYRGFSVILFAPLCALLAVLLTGGPEQVLPFFSDVFMEKMVGFVKLYFPVFLLGAVFGKMVEISGAATSISKAIVNFIGPKRSIMAIVLACAVLTYGGVSLFVVAFAVYPFAASLFKESNIPKRLIPGAIALGSFTFTMDALPGTPQIQNVIPTSFFGTNIYAAPTLGILGAIFVLTLGLLYLNWRKNKAQAAGEGYGEGHSNEPELAEDTRLPHPALAIVPLVVVFTVNMLMNKIIPGIYGKSYEFASAGKTLSIIDISKVQGIWAIEIGLLGGIVITLAIGFGKVKEGIKNGLVASVGGSMLATMNTASEYGFGGVIASLAGFGAIKNVIGQAFSNPLVNEAVSVNVLAGITGSASGGMSIALAAMGKQYLEAAQAAGISPEVLHRVASMASGGMDTLPHNGAVITLLAVTGLTHKQSYIDIFAITILKTLAVFVVIAIYSLTGII